ncbi:hypothetical protein [uncultured Methanobrevibacter sp.]|uniref:hypothetical protein n=1 Tax=uncultured Methanobrevibacter sp. TaxID=253161 RepID=UPI0026241CA6|nr:hypothetical protein [uncultured Methanobrevibacter sp.]
MEFHEDIIFKIQGQEYGQKLIEIINISGKIVEVHPTEYTIIDPKIYKPDMVFELEDKVIILEFQSSHVDINDKRRFRFYSALIDNVAIKSKKDIEVHVLSTVEEADTKCYCVNSQSRFPIYIHSLKNYDANQFLNRMNVKIENKEKFSKKELLLIGLLCFMKSELGTDQLIYDSAITITNIPGLNSEIGQFVKGVILLLCDKFVKNKSLNKTISNLVGGNMKIIEDYAQRKVDEANKEFQKTLQAKDEELSIKDEELSIKDDELSIKDKELSIKDEALSIKDKELAAKDEKLLESQQKMVIILSNEGYSTKDIVRLADVSLDFVNQTLAK